MTFNDHILTIEDIKNRCFCIDSLLGTRCLPFDSSVNFEEKITKENFFIIDGINNNGIHLINNKNEDSKEVSCIYLLDKYIDYIPFNLADETTRNFLLGKFIDIDNEDISFNFFELLFDFSLKKKIYKEIITGFYKNKKGKWFATTSHFKISEELLRYDCTFISENKFINNTPVGVIILRSK